MRHKLFFLCVTILFTLSSCTEKLTCNITSPKADAGKDYPEFFENEFIYVTVEASTNKGSILQVQMFADNNPGKSCTETPYRDTILPRTFTAGIHSISAVAYSSQGNTEIDAIYVKIKEAK
ncbi:MAG: Ig-like domain-containing protein [Lentimicrobiaceae bacterium]|nr:Ig-like domain-containing protein [Lentimicrobiaceae bacterium]